MPRIKNFEHDGKLIQLLPSIEFYEQNTYTIIVGKNGVGKSRLLANICKKLSDGIYDYHFKYEKIPLVIAASTSPFDKFPSPKKKKERDELYSIYRYVGMRGEGMYPASSAISLISSASKALLEKLLNQRNNANFLDVFESLSFSSNVYFLLKPSFSRYNDTQKSYHTRNRESFQVITDDGSDRLELDERFSPMFKNLSTEARSQVTYAMSNLVDYFESRKTISLHVDFRTNSTSLEGLHAQPHIINSIILLLNHNLIRLMDVYLHKKNHGELSLKKASSGEQCLIVLMLGIAGHIEDGSLILIDEPEISLHPRWQEEFMPLLASAFVKYKSCHFIIATHSPQIISKLNNSASYIYSLTNNILYSAKDFNDKSADFQLAELFDAPGMMNEYISRISFSCIAKLRSRGKVDNETEADLEKLTELQLKLDDNDPTKLLIESVRELYHSYAHN
ncbi:AAA family ATPase [Pseudomonas gingeri]